MKKTFIWIIIALASGAVLGKITFDKYENIDIQQVANINDKVYFLKYGTYKSEDEMHNKMKDFDRYIFIIKDNKYISYLGAAASKKNANKIKDLYKIKNINLEIEKIMVDNEEFISNLNEYEKLLDVAEDEKSLIIIENQIIACYERLVVDYE